MRYLFLLLLLPLYSYADTVSIGSGVAAVSGTAPVSVANGTTSPIVSMAAASGAADGYLASADWTTFNSKLAGPLTGDVTTSGAAATLAASIGNTHSFTSKINVGGSTTNAGTTLDVQGTTGGIGFPILTDAQRNAITPGRAGVGIWNSDNGRFEKWDGGAWGAFIYVPGLIVGENIAPAKVTVTNGVVLNTSGAQPTCESAIRGMMWVIQGGVGVADVFQICMKDGANAYGWVTK